MIKHSPSPTEALSRYRDLYEAVPRPTRMACFPRLVTDLIDDDIEDTYQAAPSSLDYDNTMVISDPDLKTYFAVRSITYGDSKPRRILLYAVDTFKGQIAGYGHVVRETPCRHSDVDLPSIGYTYTERPQRGEAYGLRRLLLLNAVSKMVLGMSIQSGEHPKRNAARHWQTLAEAELVRERPGRAFGQYYFV